MFDGSAAALQMLAGNEEQAITLELRQDRRGLQFTSPEHLLPHH